MFLGNINPLVGSWISWCFVHVFGGDFEIVANHS
jgi:hypothetical protein